MCPTLAIDSAADSHVGRRRLNNEDCFAARSDLGLFMVADGLGGKAAGEVASRIAIDAVCAYIEESGDDTWPFELERPSDRDEAQLVLGIHAAHRTIVETSRRHVATRGMATTFAAVLLSPTAATIAHVGDSRVYRYRERRLERLTRDHTLLEEMLESGASLDEIAGVAEQANAVTRALGGETPARVETRVEGIAPGDLFLVCSDGLWGPVSDGDIAATLARPGRLAAKVAGLIGRALEHGGPDNVTCVLAQIGGS